MGRKKSNLNYFSLDVDFFQDRKIRKIKRDCGVQSIAVLVSILCNIYRGYGYYNKVDEDTCFDIADEVGVSQGLVAQVIDKALKVDFFNHELYEKYNILTSKRIQENYVDAHSRRMNIKIFKKIFLIDSSCINNATKDIKIVNVDINGVNVNINEENVYINQQSKVKKSKVNNNNTNVPKKVKAQDIANMYNDICKDLSKCKIVSEKRKKAINTLLAEFTEDDIKSVFESAQQSDFLSGRNGKWTNCNFDWLINKNNTIKVFEGNYNNKNIASDNDSSSDLEERARKYVSGKKGGS